MFEVQSATQPDSPPNEGAVVEIRIPVSGEGNLREGAEGVDKKVVSVCSSMFRSDMATENQDDFFAHKTDTLVSVYPKLQNP